MMQPLEQREKGILPDEELLSLSELTEFSEGDGLCSLFEDGQPVGGFCDLVAEVSKATAAEAARLRSRQARTLYVMRAFYLLGVLRGGEAYRNIVVDVDAVPEFHDLPFTLEPVSAEDFAEELNSTPPKELDKLLGLLLEPVGCPRESRSN